MRGNDTSPGGMPELVYSIQEDHDGRKTQMQKVWSGFEVSCQHRQGNGTQMRGSCRCARKECACQNEAEFGKGIPGHRHKEQTDASIAWRITR